MTKRWSLVFAVTLLSAGAVFAAAKAGDAASKPKIDGKEIELARYAKAYIGAGNVKVDVAPYKMGAKDGAILVFHGVESAWDGKAINHRVEPGAYEGLNYVTPYQGKPFVTLVMRKDLRGKAQYELYLPDLKETVSLVPSDGEAQMLNPRAIYQEYVDQQRH
jgi:hypothetical protein